MIPHGPHPGRSLEFLARLHDGELSAAERAHFEAHRAHCAECRKAAADYEETLAVYRAAGTAPPASDLALRILRRLEKAAPRRPPFGVFFGIDVKWAGAFAAALIIAILGYSILEREQESRKISVVFVTTRPEPRAEAAPRRDGLPPLPRPAVESKGPATAGQAPPAASAAKPAPAPEERGADAAKPAAPVHGAAPAGRENVTVSGKARSVATQAQRPGGEGARSASAASAAERAGAVRVTVSPLDSQGTPPELTNAADIALSAQDRGEYVLLVNAQGIPIRATRYESRRQEAGARKAASVPDQLRRLRFQGGDRPRRLLVRVE